MVVAPRFLGYGRVTSLATGVTPTITTATSRSFDTYKAGRFLFDVPDHLALIASLCLVAGAALIVLAIRSQPRQLNLLLIVGLTIVLVGYGIWFGYGSRTFVVGLFPTFPLIVFALAYPGYRGRWVYPPLTYKFVAITALLFLTLMLSLWPSYGSFQWGSRYLLPVYPLLLFMGWFTFASYEQFLADYSKRARTLWRLAAICLLLTSTLLQFTGIRTLRSLHQEMGQVQTVIADLPAEIILTNHYYLGSLMAPLPEKQFLYVRTTEDIEKLVRRFAAAGVNQIAIVPGTIHRRGHPPLEVPNRVEHITLYETEPMIYELR
jgi:hypothetical protein